MPCFNTMRSYKEMSKRRRGTIPQQTEKAEKPNPTSAILLIFSGTIALLFEIEIYRKTIIPFGLPFGLWLLTGIISLPLTPASIKGNRFIIRLFYCIMGYGGLLVTSLMVLNNSWQDSEMTTYKLPIIETGHQAAGRGSRCRLPYAVVNIYGIEKSLLFPCDTIIKGHTDIMIQTREGLLGFDVIVGKSLF
ncbi:MAG: hypothetical protein KF744_07160 [Taibaiella sp.]|nr:hypothetical protein [Taibaiella sp.]